MHVEPPAARTPLAILRTIFSARMLVALVMGFSSGLPLLLTGTLLQAWMKQDGVNLSVIGLFALVGLPYTLKFLWAPVVDRFTPPLFGRRRGWMLVTQIGLIIALIGLSLSTPAANPWLLAMIAMCVTFFSASQDIVIDAYRREALADHELGLGSAMYVNGYRIGMLFASGGGLILADLMPFSAVFQLMAVMMLAGVITALFAREPDVVAGTPRTIKAAVIEPFLEFFHRDGALLFLAFILLYKLGEAMATSITTPFYLDLGFSKTEIGVVVKLFGFWAAIAGGTLGGILILRWGTNRALWIFGFLQMIATLGFMVLAHIGHDVSTLAAVITIENLAAGMGTSAFVGFMGALADKRFTATQYALLTSLMGVPRVIISAPTGWMAEMLGWSGFFIACTFIAVPGLLVLNRFAPWRSVLQRTAHE